MAVPIGETDSRWVPFRAPRPQATVKLICLPHAGGGATSFRLWPREMPAWIEVVPVQLPGRETRLREPPFRRMGDLVEALQVAIASDLAGPYALFGHSMGAWIAFELARARLRQGKRAPSMLFVSGAPAPHLRDAEQYHLLSDVDLLQRLRLLEGTAAKVLDDPEMMRIILPIVRADLELIETHEYRDEGPAIDFPLIAYHGDADGQVGPERVDAWRRHSTRFESQIFSGGHHFLHSNHKLVLHHLVERLERSLTA